MTRAALWDMDGTLVGSAEYHWLAWRETMGVEGVSITREQFAATFGQRNDSIIPHWLPDASADDVQRIGDRKEEAYRRFVVEGGIEPLPGAAEWVQRLAERGWAQAVASSAPRKNLEVVLDALGMAGRFQALSSAEDVAKGKPDPQVFLVAASRLGVEPSSCVVVEDAEAGVEAARRGGMRSVGVGDPKLLAGADLAVASLADLPPDAFETLLGL